VESCNIVDSGRADLKEKQPSEGKVSARQLAFELEGQAEPGGGRRGKEDWVRKENNVSKVGESMTTIKNGGPGPGANGRVTNPSHYGPWGKRAGEGTRC